MSPFTPRALRGLDIRALIELRGRIDAMIKDRAPELQAEIKALQETLQAIKG